MSFASLRDQRQTRQTKSLVNQSNFVSAQSDASEATAIERPTQSAPSSSWPILLPSPYDLPANVEIRQTPTAGRTLVARELIKAGDITYLRPLPADLGNQATLYFLCDLTCTFCRHRSFQFSALPVVVTAPTTVLPSAAVSAV